MSSISPSPAARTSLPRHARLRAAVQAGAAVAAVMLTLDLAWLGVVARAYYDAALGPLKAPQVVWPAALLFYAMYVGAVVLHAVTGSGSLRGAFARGAALGLVAYATYELTNWAVLRDWPAALVPVDIAWGVVLTGTCALVGKAVHARALRPGQEGRP